MTFGEAGCVAQALIAGLRPAWASSTWPHRVRKEITWRIRAESQMPQN